MSLAFDITFDGPWVAVTVGLILFYRIIVAVVSYYHGRDQE